MPILSINDRQNKQKGENYYNIHPKLILKIKNGLILKINKTYIPIRRNEMEIQLNLVDFSSSFIEFKLIGALQKYKLSYSIRSRKQISLSIIDFNTRKLYTNLMINKLNNLVIEQIDGSIVYDSSKLTTTLNKYKFNERETIVDTPTIDLNLSLEELERKLIKEQKV